MPQMALPLLAVRGPKQVLRPHPLCCVQALRAAKTVLDNEKNPRLLENRPHTYDDKYVVSNAVTNVALTASEVFPHCAVPIAHPVQR